MKKFLSVLLALVMVCLCSVALCDAAAETEVLPEAKSEGVMTYAEFAAAEVETAVVVETYIQDRQGWWEKEGVGGVATFYTEDQEGGYFLYDMPCTAEEYELLVPGTKIKVSGYKAEWSGEVEIIDATWEILEGNYIAEPIDATALLGTEELLAKQNMRVAFKGMTVAASKDADGNEAAWLYKWNGAGQEGDDLYFNVAIGDQVYTFLVESYLRGADTEVYAAVKALNIGDVIDLDGFMYWYEGPQAHIINVAPAAVAE